VSLVIGKTAEYLTWALLKKIYERKNMALILLFNIFFIVLAFLLFVHTNVLFLFLMFPLIPLIMFLRNLKWESPNVDKLEKQLKIKQEIMDDIHKSVSDIKRRYKDDLVNESIMLSKNFERLRKKIDKSKLNEDCKRELMDYLNKQMEQT